MMALGRCFKVRGHLRAADEPVRPTTTSRWHFKLLCQMPYLMLLCVNGGCQVSLPVAAAVPDGSCWKCRQVLARQIVVDSCQALARHPLLATSHLLCEEGDRIRAGI